MMLIPLDIRIINMNPALLTATLNTLRAAEMAVAYALAS